MALAGSTGNGERRRHKVREEIELEVSDGKSLARIFEGLGMNAWFRYEKLRTTFRLPGSRGWAKGLLIELGLNEGDRVFGAVLGEIDPG